jgi:hypothetical protein
MYNLTRTVNFATRIQNDLSTTDDNIVFSRTRFSSSSASSIINGLSDHDAQYFMICSIAAADLLGLVVQEQIDKILPSPQTSENVG